MSNEPKTMWGKMSRFIQSMFDVGTDITHVVESAVSMADDQVSALETKMEEELAAELEGYHDQVVNRTVLANAQAAQALVEFAVKNPSMAEFVKDETAKLDGAVARFRARKAARRAGALPY